MCSSCAHAFSTVYPTIAVIVSCGVFAVCRNDLPKEMKQLNIGVRYDDEMLRILLHADDVILNAETEQDLQNMCSQLV